MLPQPTKLIIYHQRCSINLVINFGLACRYDAESIVISSIYENHKLQKFLVTQNFKENLKIWL